MARKGSRNSKRADTQEGVGTSHVYYEATNTSQEALCEDPIVDEHIHVSNDNQITHPAQPIC